MKKEPLPLLERVIMTISPSWALERLRAKGMFEMMENVRKYAAASISPLTEDWIAGNTSANAEIMRDISKLRNRMRELVRNDGWAFAAVSALTNNIVGNGIMPYITGPEELKKKVEPELLKWCNGVTADYYGQQNFYGLQRMAIQAVAESGDVIVLKRYKGIGKNMQLSIHIVESDYLVDWYNANDLTGFAKGVYCECGVYFNKEGVVIGYELYRNHPGNSYMRATSMEHFFCSVDDCFLLFRPKRPGQQRGVPEGHSVMMEHKMLNQYELAQAHKQTVSASYAVFITTANAQNYGKESNVGPARNYFDVNGETITPGMMVNLYPGEDVKFAEPPTIGDYDPYTRNRLRKMAKGWGLSYEVLSGDLSSVNFSSGRMGWIEMHRNIEAWQTHMMIPNFCSTVANWWLKLEQLKGTIPLDLKGIEIGWTAPRREMIDPVKETAAMIDQIQSGLLTYAEALRELGKDPSRVMEEIAQSNDALTKLNLVLLSDFRNIHAEKMKGSLTPPAKADGSKD